MTRITERRFFQLATLLPIMVPLAAIALGAALPWREFEGSIFVALLASVFLVLGYSLLVGGIPYLLFAGVALWWLRRQPPTAYRRFGRVAPLYFALVLGVGGIVVGLLGPLLGYGPATGVVGAFGAGAMLAVVAIAFGYAYVLLAEWVRVVLVRAGCLDGLTEAPQPTPAAEPNGQPEKARFGRRG